MLQAPDAPRSLVVTAPPHCTQAYGVFQGFTLCITCSALTFSKSLAVRVVVIFCASIYVDSHFPTGFLQGPSTSFGCLASTFVGHVVLPLAIAAGKRRGNSPGRPTHQRERNALPTTVKKGGLTRVLRNLLPPPAANGGGPWGKEGQVKSKGKSEREGVVPPLKGQGGDSLLLTPEPRGPGDKVRPCSAPPSAGGRSATRAATRPPARPLKALVGRTADQQAEERHK